MFTTGSKWFLGLGLVSLVLAAAYGWTTGGTGLGPVTAGYNGGVGDHFGYAMLLAVAGVAIFLGVLAIATRDANPSALAQLAGTDEAPQAVPPAHTAYWPILGAAGLTTLLLGLVISNVLFVASAIFLIAVLVEWMVLAWSDRATGDPETNRLVRARVLGPYEVPLAGVILAGVTVAALSRLLLTSSEHGAVWVATGAATAIFVLGAIIATKPKISANVIAGVVVVAAIGLITGGVIAAARGERYIEHHEEVHEGEGGEAGSGLTPFVPAGTRHSQTTTTTEAQG
jgi:hypothetical protein